jgi:hypothetical protein
MKERRKVVNNPLGIDVPVEASDPNSHAWYRPEVSVMIGGSVSVCCGMDNEEAERNIGYSRG